MKKIFTLLSIVAISFYVQGQTNFTATYDFVESPTNDELGALTGSTNLGVDLVKKDKTTIYSENGQINVKSETKVSSVEVYDTTGRLLKSSKSAQVSISRSSSPIVVVKVQLTDGTVITKKVKL